MSGFGRLWAVDICQDGVARVGDVDGRWSGNGADARTPVWWYQLTRAARVDGNTAKPYIYVRFGPSRSVLEVFFVSFSILFEGNSPLFLSLSCFF